MRSYGHHDNWKKKNNSAIFPHQITAYEFRRNGIQVALSTLSTLTISSQTQDGSYTCVAYINSQQSLVSNAQTITFFVRMYHY